MGLHTTLHLHNVSAGGEAGYAAWFDGPHRSALQTLRGFDGADRFEVTAEQIMPMIAQPWRFVSTYDFDLTDPAIDVPALGLLIAGARDSGLIADDDTERLYTYRMFSDWKGSANWRPSEPFSGISIILGNYVAGREAAYHKWYDEVHSVEVTSVPGQVALKRGGAVAGPDRAAPLLPGRAARALWPADRRSRFHAQGLQRPDPGQESKRDRHGAAIRRRLVRSHRPLFSQDQWRAVLAGRGGLRRRSFRLPGPGVRVRRELSGPLVRCRPYDVNHACARNER